MITKIDKKKIIGYFLIYFMLIWNQTNLGEIYLKKYSFPVLIFFAMMLFVKSKRLSIWCGMCSGVLILTATLLRYTVSGIGITALLSLLTSIYIVGVAVAYNKGKIFTRVFNMIVFLATISLVLWLLCSTFPNVYKKILPVYNTLMTYRIYSDSNIYREFYYTARGLFFYTMREVDGRNSSIFTEPGIYQMVLNIGIFIALFINKKIFCKNIKLKVIILIITLCTTQSTTGMVGLLLIIFFYLFLYSKKEKLFNKKIFFMLILFILIGIVVDYQIRGTDSIVYISIIEKLFSKGSFSLVDNTSSFARAGTILISIESMIKHPLGIGYDNLHLLLKTEETGFVAAEILAFGAVWGIVPLIFVLWWIFSPLHFKLQKNIYILFILLYINTLLAQSNIFYPILILIPLAVKYLSINKRLI